MLLFNPHIINISLFLIITTKTVVDIIVATIIIIIIIIIDYHHYCYYYIITFNTIVQIFTLLLFQQHMALRRTEVIIWDSTIPTSLLNVRECHVLHEAGMSHHPLYQDPLHSCSDLVHSDNLTNQDEITMLSNLLCNEYLTKEGKYCC